MPSAPPSTGPRVRVPGPALAAGVLALLAAAALALLVLVLLGLARWGGDAIAAWLFGLLPVPPLQFVAAILLLRRRGWLPLALTSLPGVALSGYLLLWFFSTGDTHLQPLLLGCVVLPPVVLVLTLLPATRTWACGASA